MKHIKLFENYFDNLFDMEEFKKLNSFNKRIIYCQEHLERISSGSSRIVYKIDDKTVLKLARNTKGLLQNEVEYDMANDLYVNCVAEVYEVDPKYYWIRSEMARKLTKPEFKKLTGFNFDDYTNVMQNHYYTCNPGVRCTLTVNKKIVDKMWENEFTYNMLDYMMCFDIPVVDITKLNSYGIVNRDGEDSIVLIDYGFTNEVKNVYYKKK